MKAAGFSLLEVLVATAVVTVGVASLAQLFVVSARANRTANTTSMALLLAGQKMEELRGETDLRPSPAETLSANTPGYVDYLDPTGVSLGISSSTPPTGPLGAAYVCRWSIEPLPTSPVNTLVLQVVVIPWPPRGAGEARLVSVKRGKSS